VHGVVFHYLASASTSGGIASPACGYWMNWLVSLICDTEPLKPNMAISSAFRISVTFHISLFPQSNAEWPSLRGRPRPFEIRVDSGVGTQFSTIWFRQRSSQRRGKLAMLSEMSIPPSKERQLGKTSWSLGHGETSWNNTSQWLVTKEPSQWWH